MLNRILEHYFRWHVVYGIAAGLIDILAASIFNESVVAISLNLWNHKHWMAVVFVVAVVLIFIVFLSMAVLALYTIFFGKAKKNVGYEDYDEADE